MKKLFILNETMLFVFRLINHIIQSILYMVNLTIAYFLMNISMCLYSGHFLALILGFTFGYYILNVASPESEDLSALTVPTKQDETVSAGPSNRPQHSLSFPNPVYEYDQI